MSNSWIKSEKNLNPTDLSISNCNQVYFKALLKLMLITFLFFLIIWSIRRALPNSNKAISYRKISVDSFTASSLD